MNLSPAAKTTFQHAALLYVPSLAQPSLPVPMLRQRVKPTTISLPMPEPHEPLLTHSSSSSSIPPSYSSSSPQPPSYGAASVPKPATQGSVGAPSALGAGEEELAMDALSRKSQWLVLAVASGACAAFNGVFAKLTTTQLTTSIAGAIAEMLGLGSGAKAVEVVIRGMFFGLNLIFNGVMWTLFTKALARGTSTTQVSIINTSSNFMITAVLGFLIFSESLPPLWWLGAAMLVAGNVIIGRREEKEVDPGVTQSAAENGESEFGEDDILLNEEPLELTDEMDNSLKTDPDDDDLLVLHEQPVKAAAK